MTGASEELDVERLLDKILALERECDDNMGTAERKEAEKAQKKRLRDIRKLVADPEVSQDDKIAELMKRCIHELKEVTRLQIQTSKQESQIEHITMEREQVKLELQKSNALVQKLQTLCRELQKQNKQVADDSKRMADEEHQKRLELNEKFGETIKDISARLDEHSAERTQQLQENIDLREKLKKLLEQFDLREAHWEKQLHAKGLEVQLAEAKLEHQVQSGAQVEIKARQFAQQIDIMHATETELRKQLDNYGEKFKEFQDTLKTSNEVFSTMKADSQKQLNLVRSLEKRLKQNEAARRELSSVLDKRNAELIIRQTECEKLNRKLAALESLCRAMQDKNRGVVTADASDSSDAHIIDESAGSASTLPAPDGDEYPAGGTSTGA